MKAFLFATILLFLSLSSISQNCTLEGKIIDKNGESIPYASIYIPELLTGSMANVNGDFSLNLKCGEYVIKVQSLGFESKVVKIQLDQNLDDYVIKLNVATYKIGQVDISSKSEDPAYNMIRKAIVMSQYYRDQISSYETDLYIRSFYEVGELPWLIKKLADEEDINEIETGNIAETLLHYSYEKPNKVKEIIIARKTGNNDTSKTGSSYINLNFYNLGGIDMINPLSKNSFQVYEFEHISTFFESNRKIHKIKIIPKRKGNDLIEGHLYINDGIWNINNVDVTFNQPLATIDYKQQYNQVKPLLWMPINHKIKVKGAMLGIEVEMQYLANLTNLKVETDSLIDEKIKQNLKNYLDEFEKEDSSIFIRPNQSESISKTEKKIEELIYKEELTNRETLKLVRLIKKQSKEEEQKEPNSDSTSSLEISRDYKVEYADSAFSQNDSLWMEERDIPLSDREKQIYIDRDTLNNGKKKSDTIQNNKKRSSFSKLLFYNGNIKSENNKNSYQPRGLLIGFFPYFNTVDGFAPEKKIMIYNWTDNLGKTISVTPYIGYAVARKTYTGRIKLESQYQKEKRGRINFTGGRRTIDYNREESISDRLNTIATTFFTGNFKKLYQSDFVELEHQIDPVNGLEFGVKLAYARRKELSNNSDFQLFDLTNRIFTPNIPANENVFANPELTQDNIGLNVDLSLKWTPNQYYTYRNNKKILVKSKYPTFGFGYRKGISGVLESVSDYDMVRFSVNQSFSYRLLDKVTYYLEAGKFLSNSTIFFADYQNFNTTPSFVIDNDLYNGFRLLDYYGFNTKDEYFEAHLAIENDHIILKRLPIINNTSMDEKLEFSYLITERNIHYYEAGLSLTNIFFLMDAGGFVSFRDQEFESFYFKLKFYFFK